MTAILKLRKLRKQKKWTQAETARRLGVTPRALRSWEEAARHPKPIVKRAIELFVKDNAK